MPAVKFRPGERRRLLKLAKGLFKPEEYRKHDSGIRRVGAFISNNPGIVRAVGQLAEKYGNKGRKRDGVIISLCTALALIPEQRGRLTLHDEKGKKHTIGYAIKNNKIIFVEKEG